ncbi:hypothetical protein ANO11243_094930 [Dothideomycetidae sp. 11243]|nr:hypothetical protein ANO11243_094930 [fungal sp. No.11243]
MRSRPNAAGYRSADGEEARGTFRRIFKCCFTTADGEPHPRPSRRLYIPRHAERDALRSFRPPLPVLPRELRCAKSDFLMDRLRPEPTESRSDSLVPNAGQMLSYQYKGLQQFMGRKNASTTDTSDRGASDLLGAPLNVNMALAARTMPQFGTPAGLADKSVFSHAMSEPTQFPFVVNDPRLTQRGNQGRKLVLSLKTDLSSSNDSHTTAAVTGETLLGDYVLSSQGGVSPTRSPALHLAAQRNLIMDKDHVYFRHGHIPHRMRSEPISYRSSHPSSAGQSQA